MSGDTSEGKVDRFFGPALTIDELVFQALGAASMCWEHVDRAGVFDSDRARRIAEELLGRLSPNNDRQLVDTLVIGLRHIMELADRSDAHLDVQIATFARTLLLETMGKAGK